MNSREIIQRAVDLRAAALRRTSRSLSRRGVGAGGRERRRERITMVMLAAFTALVAALVT